jgi:hypothetical protein
MFIKMLKQTLLLTCLCVVSSVSTVTAAPKTIPQAITIPETLRDGKLLTQHKKQVDDRIAWWKESLLVANNDKDIQRATNKLLDDYRLYPNPSYQKQFAEETLRQFTNVLNGKVFKTKLDDPTVMDDRLATLKRINAALVLAQMDQLEMQPALQILVADKNEALRFIGWEGYEVLRKSILNSTEKNLKPLLDAVKTSVGTETNPILLSAVYRVMNLGKIEGTVSTRLRLTADAAFLDALRASWSKRCKQVQSAAAREKFLPAMKLAVLALRSIGSDLKKTGSKGEASVKLCLQMVFDVTAAAAQAYDRALQKHTPDDALREQCTDLLLMCEDALNTLAGAKNTFIADKTNLLKKVPARGAAVMEAVLVHWAEALKDKGVKESPAEEQP